MSASCFGRVQDYSKNEGVAYLLLLMLADWAHDDGEGRCPPMATMAQATRTPEREIPRLLEKLKRSGELTWNNPPGRYRIRITDPGAQDRATQFAAVYARDPRAGYVYLLQSDHGYKIGMSRDVPTRMKALGIQLPFNVELIHTIPSTDAAWAESYLHHTFEHCRMGGEWFDLTPDEVAWLQDITSLEPQ